MQVKVKANLELSSRDLSKLLSVFKIPELSHGLVLQRHLHQGRQSEGSLGISGLSDGVKVYKLEVVKLSSPDVIIKLLHDVPGTVPDPHQHDGERQLAGLHYSGHCGGLVLHLAVSDDDEDVEDVVALHHVVHGSPDDWCEASGSTEHNSLDHLVILLKNVIEVLTGPTLDSLLLADVDDGPVLALAVPEAVGEDCVELDEGEESLADDIDHFLIWIVDRSWPRVKTVRSQFSFSPKRGI